MITYRRKVHVHHLLIVAVIGLWGLAPVHAFANEVPCGPNGTIPAGYGTCREANGAIRVGPPPGYRTVIVAPPTVYRPVVAYPPANPGTGRTTIATPVAPGRSTWLTIAGITAIAGLITACASLVRAFR